MTAPSTDVAMFDPVAWRLSDHEVEVAKTARELGETLFAGRAEKWDRDAIFPTANYEDMHKAGLLGICVPEEAGGLGAGFRGYAMAAAEIGRYCGATALTWNMHVSSTLWTGALADDLDLTKAERARHNEGRKLHFKRIIEEGAIYSQPFSEGSAAAAGFQPFATKAVKVDGGYRISGKKIFASLAGHADYYGTLCTLHREGKPPSRGDTLYLAIPKEAEGLQVVGDWDPLGMRGTVSRTLLFDDVFVGDHEELMPQGVYFKAASSWPHMFLTLSPAYLGIAQAAYDFTIKYLRGEVPGMPPVKRRMYPTKQIAVAEMRVKLDAAKSLWFQTVSEARCKPSKDQVLRAYVTNHTVMETSCDMCRLAIRTCGGQSMLKTLPLERLYRDSRCGSLMLPWTAELCLDRIGRESLYEAGETDD
jgi:alkylation response protein AidB-like acyl-CoA dehydrogenase